MSNDRTRKHSYHPAKQQQVCYNRISIIKWTDLAIFLFGIIMYIYVLTSPSWSQTGKRRPDSWSGRSSRTHRRSRRSLLSSALKGFTTTQQVQNSVWSLCVRRDEGLVREMFYYLWAPIMSRCAGASSSVSLETSMLHLSSTKLRWLVKFIPSPDTHFNSWDSYMPKNVTLHVKIKWR